MQFARIHAVNFYYKTHDFRIADLKCGLLQRNCFARNRITHFFTPCFSLVVCKFQFFLALAINFLYF